MTCKPVVFSGVFYPKNKKDPPIAGTFVGNFATPPSDAHPEHPIVIPPELGEGDGDLIIWGPPDPRPTPPIVIPPDNFPEPPPGGAIKPFPPDGGWGYSDRTGWVFKPGSGEASPKGPRR